MTFKDYTKCRYANKTTLAGYLLMKFGLLSGTWIYFELSKSKSFGLKECIGLSIFLFSSVIGFLLNALVSFGVGTLLEYRRAKERIKVGNFSSIKISNGIPYCFKVGRLLALKEAGLERELLS